MQTLICLIFFFFNLVSRSIINDYKTENAYYPRNIGAEISLGKKYCRKITKITVLVYDQLPYIIYIYLSNLMNRCGKLHVPP